MEEGKGHSEWTHTALQIVNSYGNANRKKPFGFDDVFPYATKKKREEPIHDMTALKKNWRLAC